MPYMFNLRGIPVTCTTLDELLQAVHAGLADSHGPAPLPAGTPIGMDSQQLSGSPSKVRPNKPQGTGPKRAWAEAEEYAKKHGITKGEARSILAKKNREAMAQAVGKNKE